MICDDATFLRRATVDIAGRLPSAEEAEKFIADKNVDKRDKWIDRLLDSAAYADYFANKWSALLRNKRTDAKQARTTYAFHGWIRDNLLANKPYVRFVRDILAATGDRRHNPAVAWCQRVRRPRPE